MYVTRSNFFVNNFNQIPPVFPFFGSIEAADYYANFEAHQAGLFDWDGTTPVFKAVMSALNKSARNRLVLEPGKPILNVHGQQIVASSPELFNGDSTTLHAPILEEFGTAPPPNTPVWTGTLANGLHSNSCTNWSNPSISGLIGLANATDGTWCQNGLRDCNLSGRIYGLGILESPRAPGDYNFDGSVDSADYVLWRNTLGQRGLLLPADGNGSGTVDAADYDVWKQNHGWTSPLPKVFNVPTDSAPSVIGTGTTLNLFAGGTIGPVFDAGLRDRTTTNVTVNIHGGTIGHNFDANSGSTVNFLGGTVAVDHSFQANEGSVVNISSGTITGNPSTDLDGLEARGGTINVSGGLVNAVHAIGNGSVVNITGGSVGSAGASSAGSVLHITGGSLTRSISGGSSGTVNISGGTTDGTLVFQTGAIMNLFGTNFELNGLPIPGLTPNEAFTVTDRNVTLSGLLTDGSPFSFDLNTDYTGLNDFVDANVTLRVTLVMPAASANANMGVFVPEPPTLTLWLVLGLVLSGRQARRKLASGTT